MSSSDKKAKRKDVLDEVGDTSSNLNSGFSLVDNTVNIVSNTRGFIENKVVFRDAHKYVQDVKGVLASDEHTMLKMELEYSTSKLHIGVKEDVGYQSQEIIDIRESLIGMLDDRAGFAEPNEFVDDFYSKDHKYRDMAEELGVEVKAVDTEYHTYTSKLYSVKGFHADPVFENTMGNLEGLAGRSKRPYKPLFLDEGNMMLDSESYMDKSNPLVNNEHIVDAYGYIDYESGNRIPVSLVSFHGHVDNLKGHLAYRRTSYDRATLRVYGPPEVYQYDKNEYEDNLLNNGGKYRMSDDQKLTVYEFSGDNLAQLSDRIKDISKMGGGEGEFFNMTHITQGVLESIRDINNRVRGIDADIQTDKKVSIQELEQQDRNEEYKKGMFDDWDYEQKAVELEERLIQEGEISSKLEDERIIDSYHRLEAERQQSEKKPQIQDVVSELENLEDEYDDLDL